MVDILDPALGASLLQYRLNRLPAAVARAAQMYDNLTGTGQPGIRLNHSFNLTGCVYLKSVSSVQFDGSKLASTVHTLVVARRSAARPCIGC